MTEYEILINNGKISTEIDKTHAESEFEKYSTIKNKIYVSDFDTTHVENNYTKIYIVIKKYLFKWRTG